MKWFRHFATDSKERVLAEAVATFKAPAFMLYFVTLEIIAEEQLDIVGECEVLYDNYLNRIKCSSKTAKKILEFFKEGGELDYELRGVKIWLKDQNFYGRVDEYTKRQIQGSKPDRRRKEVNYTDISISQNGLKEGAGE